MIRFVHFGLGILALVGVGTAFAETESAADRLIALTRETHATYTLILRNRILRPDGSVYEEWSAEFHDGTLHRVETPRDRVIADCEAGTGSYTDFRNGKLIDGPSVAGMACGINANSPIISAKIEGMRESRFGRATHLVVHDPNYIRTYDVAENGALVGATISDRSGKRLLTNWAVYLSSDVPPGIFSRDSLGHSAVSERFRRLTKDEAAN